MTKNAIICVMLALTYAFASNGQTISNSDGSKSESKVAGYPVSDQSLYRNIYFELFGPSAQFGVSYDSRFTPGSMWGYRIGLGMGIGGTLIDIFKQHGRFSIGIPLEVNGLIGKGSNKFEAGLGTNLGLVSRRYDKLLVSDEITDGFNHYSLDKSSQTRFYYFMFVNLGYRLQRKNGFMLRAGITPTFRVGGSEAVKDFDLVPYVTPYLSLGYTFK